MKSNERDFVRDFTEYKPENDTILTKSDPNLTYDSFYKPQQVQAPNSTKSDYL